jgi:hypothetical protein
VAEKIAIVGSENRNAKLKRDFTNNCRSFLT